jgi:glycosyltransferase involved in cell wall biosynthesis
MKILFIAPLPPPINGQSLAAQIFLKEIERNNEVAVVNMAKKRPKNILDRVSRYFEVIKFLEETFHKNKNIDLIYLTISESFQGNIKDLFIYLICFRRLRKMIIHMLGGAGMKRILDKRGIQYKLNNFFMSRLRGVIVEGQTQATTFSKVIHRDKIHIVPNFVEDFLFVSEQEIREKFSNIYPLKILFLSNLLFGKGHNELVDAYLSLKDEIKEKVKIVFVGGFESDNHKNEFFKRIEKHKNLIYYGNFVSGDKKRALYCESHIFCLPTYYPYEGQPISILEAYATGCVVITTKHSGIPDVFCDNVNGFGVDKRSANSIKLVIEQIIDKNEGLLDMAISNRNIAYGKYRTSIYKSSLLKIIESVGD